MSAFEWNKIIGAILVATLIIKVIDLAGDALTPKQSLAKPAYPVTARAPAEITKPAPAQTASAPAAIGPLLAQASVDAGKRAARKCATCHSMNKDGKNKVGPTLWNIVGGKKAGGRFSYSGALKKLGGNWDFEALNHFLASPKAFAPGTKMAFAGIRKPADRAALIAYLRTLSDNPVSLP